METIKYIGYYAIPGSESRRSYTPAGVSKMDYIISTLNRLGYAVEVVSKSNSPKFEHGSLREIRNGVRLKQFMVIGNNHLIKRVVNRMLLDFEFACYLWRNIQKGDTVLAYHSMGYAHILYLLRKWKKFKLILEVEEIYSDVTGDEQSRKKEMKLFHAADAYIFPTGLLDEQLNPKHKPSVIVHGTYQAEEQRLKCKFDNDPLHQKKHLLYAGTFDPRKGGALAAAAAAEYLPSDYHIHILGFGSEEDKKILQHEIDRIAKLDCAAVTMDGLLSGEDYIQFVQSCDVGLSTQMPDAAFNNTSFPSKVLSYLANGLRVVSVCIPALERSAVSDLLYYYKGDSPKDIAEAVMSVNWSDHYDSRVVIQELDRRFQSELKSIIERF